MSLLRNGAFWILVSAIALFAFANAILGTPLTRDVVDILGITFCSIMALRLLPDAIDRFKRGGAQKNWQLLMANFLFFSGWVMFSAWAFIIRSAMVTDHEMYEWMRSSWVNGFFRFWILGAAVTAFFSTTDIPTPIGPAKIYYIGIGVMAGILIGVAGSQLAGMIGT